MAFGACFEKEKDLPGNKQRGSAEAKVATLGMCGEAALRMALGSRGTRETLNESRSRPVATACLGTHWIESTTGLASSRRWCV